MAPRKRKTTEQEEKQRVELAAQVAQDSGRRMTRGMTRAAASGSSAEPWPLAPAWKKGKGAQKKKEPAKKEEVEEEEAEGEAVKEENENSGESEAEAEAENKNKKEKGKEKVKAEVENQKVKGKAKVEDDDDKSDKRTIVIEHCKQCKSFKETANQVKNGLEKGVPGIKVLLNPDTPRRGCLEIREEGGETFISLLGMKRPFLKMKELNMEKVISDIIEKIK